MRYRLFIITKLAILFGIILPFGVFAETDNAKCSPVGYSVFTINGIFTNKKEAIFNRDSLKRQLPPTFNSEPLTVDYLHNPSHLGGIGDVAKVVYQKIFDNETVEDYDLIEMLKSASEKIKTQKLLLVAHSQGNFYANSFYDIVAGKPGGVPTESIGVYGVATPSGRVAGGGKWLTSDTDKIIAGIVGRMPFKKIMPPNTHIESQNGDDANGHNFKDVYLKYKSAEIVSDIQSSLNRLSANASRNENSPCLSAPELTATHKLEGAVLAVADPVASAGSDAAALAGTAGAKATVWAYNNGIEAAKNVGQTALAAVSSLTGAAKSLMSGARSLTGKNEAMADIAVQDLPISQMTSSAPSKQSADIAASAGIRKSSVAPPTSRTGHLATVSFESIPQYELPLLSEIPVKSPPSKIVFVGPRILGIGSSLSKTAEKIETAEAEAKEKTESATEEELSAPALTVPQCDQSIATNGCLIATTTARFEWAPVSGASYYALNENGVYATTTETALDITVPDFSDYVFEVASVGEGDRKSAASAKTISVATIPIAINEIAWMGTTASPYDEWLELKNNTKYAIDLSQWALGSLDSAPYIVLSGSIAPHEYRVLERRKDAVVVNAEVSAYGNGSPQWALENSGEELALSRASVTLDKTPAVSGGSWAAGDNSASTSRKTMERIDSKQSGATTTNWATWGTNIDFVKTGQDAEGNRILGTPGECNSASFANINGGQNIASSTTLEANNCYYVSAGVRVSASSTLTIEEGARVSIRQNNLYIDGVLAVKGETDNPVVFDSFSGTPTLNGVKISGSAGTSTVNNMTIANTGGVILDNGASLEISNANFSNNNAGIELSGGSAAIIENANFSSTTNEAVAAYGGSVVSIASSTITNAINADAIGVYGSSLSMSSTSIDTVRNGDGIGAYNSTISLASSTVSNVLSGDGIGLYNSTATIANVAVENVAGDGIAVYGGSISGNATIDGVKASY